MKTKNNGCGPAIQWTVQIGSLLICSILLYFLHRQSKANAIRASAETVRVSIVEIESSQRAYLLTADPAYLASYIYYRALMAGEMDALCISLPKHSELATRYMKQLRVDVGLRLDLMEQTVDHQRKGEVEEAIKLVRTNQGKQLQDQVELDLDHIRGLPPSNDR